MRTSTRNGDARESCDRCGREIYRNQLPHGVEIGNPRKLVCVPCYRVHVKRGGAANPEAIETRNQYLLFLKG